MVDHASHPKPKASPGQSFAPASPEEPGDRVAKVLARAGVASRREVERLIAEGRVALNGQILTTPAVKVGPSDILTVNGEVVTEAEPTRLWRYHKPVGLVTTHNDPKGRPTVFENLPEGLPRVISVGRLDLSSEGLLLLTNDGALARALELPSTGLIRRYRARAYGQADQSRLDRLRSGATVEGVVYGPIDAHLDKARGRALDGGKGPANLWITVTLAEGKNREVRRVLESIGLKVNRLIRLSYGPFALAALGQGAAEEVGPRVIRELLSEHIAPQNLPKGDRVGTVLKPLHAGGMSRKSRRPGAVAEAPSESSAPAKAPKPVYKAGWAKPKKRPAAAAPNAKSKSRGRVSGKARSEATQGDKPVGRSTPAARRTAAPSAGAPKGGPGGGERTPPQRGGPRPRR